MASSYSPPSPTEKLDPLPREFGISEQICVCFLGDLSTERSSLLSLILVAETGEDRCRAEDGQLGWRRNLLLELLVRGSSRFWTCASVCICGWSRLKSVSSGLRRSGAGAVVV
ncbi:hypothetical protein MLD38_023701 [Melastoma candidum]|uniref:Uncharacterized protein n=1 Tax=Melastoma candidum TaxID=119954 RepID=A0ACB9NRC5_9MYRT|nr:hypothetical protein MLD38_023701 [Melastoma candidum]